MVKYASKELINNVKKDGKVKVNDLSYLPNLLVSAVGQYYFIGKASKLEKVDLVKLEYDETKTEDADGEQVIKESDITVTDITEADIKADMLNNVPDYLEENTSTRVLLAENRIALGSLADDDDTDVLVNVVRQDYELDRFKNSEDTFVRAEVARRGKYLDELIKDECKYVRAAVAEVTTDPDMIKTLADFDEEAEVKVALAKRDLKAEKLANDLSKWVRETVAETTCNKDAMMILVHDSSDKVKSAAVKNAAFDESLAKEALSVDEEGNFINNHYIRLEIARKAIEGKWDEILNILSDDGSVPVREEIAKSGLLSDKLLQDKEARVRQLAYLAKYEPEVLIEREKSLKDYDEE